MYTRIIKKGRSAAIKGAIKAADVVCSTHGPGKNTVLISTVNQHGRLLPYPSGDGMMVAANISLKNLEEKIGSDIALSQAIRTAKQSGDNTTETLALMAGILRKLNRFSVRRNVVKELNEALESALELLKENTVKVESIEELVKIATVAASNDPKIGKLVAELAWKIGEHGTIYVKDGDGKETTSELKPGYVIRPGLYSEQFLSRSGPAGFSWASPSVALVDDIVYDYKQLNPIVKAFDEQHFDRQTGNYNSSLVIFLREVDGNTLTGFTTTFMQMGKPIILVKVPGIYCLDVFEDLEALSGATIWSERKGNPLSELTKKGYGRKDVGFGELEKLTADRDQVTVFGKNVDEYAKQVLDFEFTDEPEREKERKARYSKLTKGVGYIHVGGSADVQIVNLGQIIDDAQGATFNALRHGYTVGGSYTLLKISESLLNTYGGRLLKSAIRESFGRKLRNSGHRWLFSPMGYYKPGYVFNMAAGEFENVSETEILDSAYSVECALRNSIAAACEIIKAGYSIIWDNE